MGLGRCMAVRETHLTPQSHWQEGSWELLYAAASLTFSGFTSRKNGLGSGQAMPHCCLSVTEGDLERVKAKL